jgi:hypothetical protein
MANIVLLVKIRGELVFRDVNIQFKTIVSTVSLSQQFIQYDGIATGQCMIGKSSISRAESGYGILEAAWGVMRELFIVHAAFQDSTVLEDNSRANDKRMDVMTMDGSIDPKVLGHALDASYFIGVLVVLEMVLHLHYGRAR